MRNVNFPNFVSAVLQQIIATCFNSHSNVADGVLQMFGWQMCNIILNATVASNVKVNVEFKVKLS